MLDKCQFCQPSVSYVGHIVSQEDVSTDLKKTEVVTTWPRPTTVKDYSKPHAERSKKKHEQTYLNPSEPFGCRWNDKCEAAFEELKQRQTNAPVLAFANSQLPYVLHVDESQEVLGGVLYQDKGERLRPVAFISCSLTPSECHYLAHKLEYLALKWAIVNKLHDCMSQSLRLEPITTL